MATLLAAGAASAAGYVIGSLATKPSKGKKHGRRSKSSMFPPLPALPPAVPLVAPAPLAVYNPFMSRAQPPLFRTPFAPYPVPAPPPYPRPLNRPVVHQRVPPPPPPLPRPVLNAPLAGGHLKAGKSTHTDKNSCPVCKRNYENGDVIARMWCEHMVHKACLEHMLNSDVVEDMKCECPHCGCKSYITRFAVAEKPRTETYVENLPGLMPVPDNAPIPMKSWDPARVSPVFFGRYNPEQPSPVAAEVAPHPHPAVVMEAAAPVQHGIVPVKGIVVTDDLSPLPASATCVGNECTPFFYSLRGGGPSCTLCDCAQCKRGRNCKACGKCVCGTCKGVDCECCCQCNEDESLSVSELSFSENGSVANTSYTASYNASSAPPSAPNSSAMFSSITPSMFNRFAYQ